MTHIPTLNPHCSTGAKPKRGIKTKEELFLGISDSAHSLAINLQYIKAGDSAEFYKLAEDGELDNGDDLRQRRFIGRTYTPWEIVALIQLGINCMETHNLAFHEIEWLGLN
jgi:hypothetical protein